MRYPYRPSTLNQTDSGDGEDMTRILIIESHQQVRQLLERMVCRLDHEPVIAAAPTVPALENIDLVIVEPCDAVSALLAEKIQLAEPLIPIICVSVLAEPPVNLAFSSRLLKPFIAADLAAAVTRALLQSHKQPRATAAAPAKAALPESDLAS
jgi:hypothetical protein